MDKSKDFGEKGYTFDFWIRFHLMTQIGDWEMSYPKVFVDTLNLCRIFYKHIEPLNQARLCSITVSDFEPQIMHSITLITLNVQPFCDHE